jgi:hypothetical protein
MWQGRELLGTVFVRWRRKPEPKCYLLGVYSSICSFVLLLCDG